MDNPLAHLDDQRSFEAVQIAPDPELHGAAPALDERPAVPNSKRKPLLLLVLGIVVVVSVAYAIYHFVFAASRVSTDNAYVGAEVAQVTPLIGGQVIFVGASDAQHVRSGQVLLRLESTDQQIAVLRAQADLAAAERRYGETAASGSALAAKIDAREADVGSARAQLSVARSNLARAEVDYRRRKALAAAGAASGDELTTAINSLANARASVSLANAAIAQAQASRASAVEDRAANAALTAGTTISNAPAVLTARAQLQQARLDLERTIVRAPIDGIVAQRNVQVGQRIAIGTPTMAVVPVDQLYVDANFKEGQLAQVEVGQPVQLTSDFYGNSTIFHGHVVGLGGGTGAAFALIPAQNATGNWIKVVQQLPVRIALEPAELRSRPLRVGLSMTASVDLSRKH